MQSGTFSVAGLQEVRVEGVENWDLSQRIHSHFDYMEKIREVLGDVRFNCGCFLSFFVSFC